MAAGDQCDLFVIGGGINGCGIARDAAGRGLSVVLAEAADLASATSSASTKLFHGGLRYLEFFEFRLVRHSLIEREILLRAMPHIAWPMRFVLPYHADMRFESDTPTSRLLRRVMPWVEAGRRPAWLIRLGLFLYDTLGGRKILPGTRTLDLTTAPEGVALQDRFARAYEYSDCWVEDSRLVVLNARDASERGARIMTRTKVIGADRDADGWTVHTRSGDGATQSHRARMLINAAGPWVGEVLAATLQINTPERVRLVRGSHIVVPRLYDHEKCYFLQGEDGRIIFAIPYERDFTLIGTTDAEHDDPETRPEISEAETDYLIAFANGYFKTQVAREDIVWTYSGVRPLYDDGASSATAATRDYVLSTNRSGAPLLSVFGGKITTYRKLAEEVMEQVAECLGDVSRAPWTAGAPLPGGDFPVDGFEAQVADLAAAFPFLAPGQARRLVRAYGRDAREMLGTAASAEDLGEDFGAGLSACELRWLMEREFARTAEDVLWRRSKLGLRFDAAAVARLETVMKGG